VRMAVASGLFPLYEVWDGATYRLNAEPDGTDPAEYYRHQNRFAVDDLDLEAVRYACERRINRLRALAQQFPATAG